MGIPGLLPHLSGSSGPPRKSLTSLSAAHYTTHSRPLRLAIDTQIWLFQIQSGRGGTNPALRTFYYRLLRLLGLNIHPLFVFDGPHKPLMKRGKRVGQAGGAGGGGGAVRVVSVPEFLAKQLLKLFGFPWHIAPGEAEAECALLQREGLVDAVLSEDVDTLMFGSQLTFRNWSATTAPINSCSGDGEAEGGAGGPRAGAATAAGGNKPPTHIDVWRAEDTFARSRGVDGEGMTLVALLSGGDYLPDGVPGIGVKVAVDAARAGFGSSLCSLARSRNLPGLEAWKEKLEHEIKTNESGFFSRRNGGWTGFPEGFPDLEVLGFYTNPCVSSAAKLAQLRREVVWDQPIDFAALRTFAGEAFDWRCLGGAKKFVKNLAPALLVRELRLQASHSSCSASAGQAANGREAEQSNVEEDDLEVQAAKEARFVKAIHGKRHHPSTDGECEYRVSFLPHAVVPIDFFVEEEEEETYVPAGGGRACEPAEDDSDAESEVPASNLVSTQQEGDESPSKRKKRAPRPYDPDEPEKLWVPKVFLQLGCPLMIEDWEASFSDPRKFLEAKRKAKAVGQGAGAQKAGGKSNGKGKGGNKASGMEEGALRAFTKVTKTGVDRQDIAAGDGKRDQRADRGALRDVCANSQPPCTVENAGGKGDEAAVPTVSTLPSSTATATIFKLPSSHAQLGSTSSQYPAPKTLLPRREIEVLDLASHDLCNDVSTTIQRPVSAPANSVARAHQQRAAASFPTLPSSQQPPLHEPKKPKKAKEATKPTTPKRPPKRRSNELCSPASKSKSPFAAISLLSSSPAVRSPMRSQQTMITAFYPPTPSPVRVRLQSTQILPSRQRAEIHGKGLEERKVREVVDLISSSPPRPSPVPSAITNAESLFSARADQATPATSRGEFVARYQTPTPPNTRFKFVREEVLLQPSTSAGAGAGAIATGRDPRPYPETREVEAAHNTASPSPSSPRLSLEETLLPGKLPETVTKRRKKGGALKRWATEGDVLCLSSPSVRAEKGEEDFDLDLGFGRDGIDELRSHVWGEDFVDEDIAFGSPSIVDSGGGFLLEHGNGREVERDFGRNECEADARDIDLLDADFREDHSVFCPGNLIAVTESRDDEYDLEAFSPPNVNCKRNTDEPHPTASVVARPSIILRNSQEQSQQLIPARAVTPSIPVLAATKATTKPQATLTPASEQPLAQSQLRRSPRQQFAQKRRIHLRQSLEGYWREVEVMQTSTATGIEAVDLSGDGSGWRISGGKAHICGEGLSRRGGGTKLGGAKGSASGWRRSGVEVLDLRGA